LPLTTSYTNSFLTDQSNLRSKSAQTIINKLFMTKNSSNCHYNSGRLFNQ